VEIKTKCRLSKSLGKEGINWGRGRRERKDCDGRESE
jgi:hypothetical protein